MPDLVSSLWSMAFAGVLCLVRSVFAYVNMYYRRTCRTYCAIPGSVCVEFAPG